MPFAAVLLDLDGTLLDTIPDLADAVNAMRVDLNLPTLSQEVIATYVGKGTKHLVTLSLSDIGSGAASTTATASASVQAQAQEPAPPPSSEQIEHGLSLFEQHYHRVNGDKAIMYPGVLEGLNAFKAQGIKLAVVTNKPTEFTLPLLERTGLAHFFEHVVCGDTCAEKKPHPMPFLHACDLLDTHPSDALAIGDSINDALAARAAKITVLAVPYGYNEGINVRNLEVDDIVTSIEAAAQWANLH